MSKTALTTEQAVTYLSSIKAGKSLPRLAGKAIRSSTKYVAGLSADLAKNNGQLVIQSAQPLVGYTNFPKSNALPKGTNWLVTAIRLTFSTDVGVTPLTATWNDNAPANWLNGEISVSQNGEGLLFDASVTDVTNAKASTGNDDDFREVIPFMLREESMYSIQALLAAAGAVDQAYKLELRVIEFIDEDKV